MILRKIANLIIVILGFNKFMSEIKKIIDKIGSFKHIAMFIKKTWEMVDKMKTEVDRLFFV